MKYTMAIYTVRPEKVKAVKKAITEFITEVRKHEPRTLYLVFRENGQHTFVHWMSFEDEAAERRHSQSRYNDRLAKKLLEHGVGKASFTEFGLFAASKKHWALTPDR
jgi:quinol monooxygenase YgiN